MKLIKCFAIEDHGALSPEQYPICDARGFENYLTTQGKTTKKAVAYTLERLHELEFDAKILIGPLKATPKLEIGDCKFHFITVRWS